MEKVLKEYCEEFPCCHQEPKVKLVRDGRVLFCPMCYLVYAMDLPEKDQAAEMISEGGPV